MLGHLTNKLKNTKTTTMAKTNKTEGTTATVDQEFVDTPTTAAPENTVEVKTGEVVVRVVATGDEFITSLNNWNSMYKDDVVSEGVYRYKLVEEKKKLLS